MEIVSHKHRGFLIAIFDSFLGHLFDREIVTARITPDWAQRIAESVAGSQRVINCVVSISGSKVPKVCFLDCQVVGFPKHIHIYTYIIHVCVFIYIYIYIELSLGFWRQPQQQTLTLW